MDRLIGHTDLAHSRSGFISTIDTNVGYREYLPHPALRQHVSCYWSSSNPLVTAPQEHRVLPDGCIDILFDLSPGSPNPEKLVGTMTQPLLFVNEGPVHLVAVRFRPGGAVPFLSINATEITDQQTELPSGWGSDSLIDQLGSQPTVDNRIDQLEQALLLRLPHVLPVMAPIQRAVTLIQRGNQRVESLAKEMGLSRQHLGRLFRQHVGVSPKVFARVTRLQQMLEIATTSYSPNWSLISAQLGYCDQAHLVHECRSLSGLSPLSFTRPKSTSHHGEKRTRVPFLQYVVSAVAIMWPPWRELPSAKLPSPAF